MAPRLATALALLVLGAVPPSAIAQVPSDFDPALDAQPSRGRRHAVGVLVGAAFDVGTEISGYGAGGLRENEGANVMAGLIVPWGAAGRRETQLVAGFKHSLVGSATANYQAATLELGQALNFARWRIGAGILGAFGGRLAGRTVAPSVGGTVRLELVVPTASRWRIAVGPQLAWMRLRVSSGAGAARSAGIVVRIDSNPAAR
jgi:hypothetical protein